MSLRSISSALLRLVTFRWWTWRLTRRLLFACAVFATLIALLYLIENWRGRRAFAEVAREASSQNITFTLSDYAAPPVPDALNLAKYPLLDHPINKPDDTYWPDLKKRFDIQRADNATPLDIPASDAPSVHENKVADFTAFQADWRKVAADSSAEDFETYLGRVSPLLDELDAASAARPRLRYEYEWEKLYAILLPQLGTLRAMARASSLRAGWQLEAGQPAAAAGSLRFPLRLRAALQPEAIIISQLVAASIGGRTYPCIWQGQLRHQWTETELALFADLLADDQILPGLQKSFHAETAVAVTLCLQLAGSDPKAHEMLAGVVNFPQFVYLSRCAPSGWAYQNAATVARIGIRESIPAIDLAASRIRLDKLVFTDTAPTDLSMPYQAIARIISPALNKVLLTIGQAKTSHDLARLAVALERHRLADGAYPESLAPVFAAHPELAGLHDPFTGAPYGYRRDADGGFTLWGVGRNAKDDGASYPEKKPSGGADYETGDLIWRVPG